MDRIHYIHHSTMKISSSPSTPINTIKNKSTLLTRYIYHMIASSTVGLGSSHSYLRYAQTQRSFNDKDNLKSGPLFVLCGLWCIIMVILMGEDEKFFGDRSIANKKLKDKAYVMYLLVIIHWSYLLSLNVLLHACVDKPLVKY